MNAQTIPVADSSNTTSDIPLPQRLSRIENMFETIMGYIKTAAPVLDIIPAAAPIVNTTLAAGGLVEKVIDEFNGTADTTDAAALAAGSIATSTGDAKLDARLATIESYIEQIGPIVLAIAKEFGFDAPSAPVSTASQVVAAATALA